MSLNLLNEKYKELRFLFRSPVWVYSKFSQSLKYPKSKEGKKKRYGNIDIESCFKKRIRYLTNSQVYHLFFHILCFDLLVFLKRIWPLYFLGASWSQIIWNWNINPTWVCLFIFGYDMKLNGLYWLAKRHVDNDMNQNLV